MSDTADPRSNPLHPQYDPSFDSLAQSVPVPEDDYIDEPGMPTEPDAAPNTRIVFLDTETTGLRPHDGHRPWEVAWIECELVPTAFGSPFLRVVARHQHFFQLSKLQFDLADRTALEIGGFAARYRPDLNQSFATDLDCLVHLHAALNGAFIAGAVIDFDCRMLQEKFRDCNIFAYDPDRPLYDPNRPWHYHIIDTEVLAAGALMAPPPYSSSNLSRKLGIVDGDGRHQAMVDAQWALDMFVAAYELAVHDPERGKRVEVTQDEVQVEVAADTSRFDTEYPLAPDAELQALLDEEDAIQDRTTAAHGGGNWGVPHLYPPAEAEAVTVQDTIAALNKDT